jgi:geranylgeranyl diphosphate synthase type II
MFDLKAYLESGRRRVNQALEAIFADIPESHRVAKAMQYSLFAGGKRIRPILCLATAEALGGETQAALNAGCAIEMIHTYSLIHDDLPAVDNDDLRRGKATCHIAFDEATAILAGDALLTLAFQVLSESTSAGNSPGPDSALQVIRRVALAAGHLGMVEGQMRDILAEGTSIPLKDLQQLHALKTGALIEAAVYAGALLGGGTPAQIASLESYARNIGIAFQVQDDVLNVEGNSARMGKATGTDQLRMKSTYPSLLGLPGSKRFARQLITSALKALEQFDNKAEPLRTLACYIIARSR